MNLFLLNFQKYSGWERETIELWSKPASLSRWSWQLVSKAASWQVGPVQPASQTQRQCCVLLASWQLPWRPHEHLSSWTSSAANTCITIQQLGKTMSLANLIILYTVHQTVTVYTVPGQCCHTLDSNSGSVNWQAFTDICQWSSGEWRKLTSCSRMPVNTSNFIFKWCWFFIGLMSS